MDRYYTSVDLFRDAKAKGYLLYGTLRLDRGVSDILSEGAKKKKLVGGEYRVVMSEPGNPELSQYFWMDSGQKPVIFLSTFHNTENKTVGHPSSRAPQLLPVTAASTWEHQTKAIRSLEAFHAS